MSELDAEDPLERFVGDTAIVSLDLHHTGASEQ